MRVRRLFRLLVWLPGGLLALTLLPATSGATVLAPWGSNLQATPSFDTANGASAANGDAATPGDNGILPNPHDAADTAIWNNQLASGSPSAAQAGQVLQIKVKGCAVKDTTVGPEDPNGNGTGADGIQYSAGIPVNEMHFQTLTPQSGGSWQVDQTSQAFFFPFCNGQTVTASTVTTFEPLHMCVRTGETVDFNDLGGFIPNPSGPSWYPQGLPYQILAPVSGSGMDSYVKADGTNSGATFSPTDTGRTNGWRAEPQEELLLQVVEGVGDDALANSTCGGSAIEGQDSNAVICVNHHTTPSDPYGTCNSSGQPVRPATNQSPPTITSPSGLYEQGQRLNGNGGTWSSPNSSPWFSWQWEDCATDGSSCTRISGATSSYYYPTSSDVGHTLRVIEYADNDSGYPSPATSAATPVIKSSGSGSTTTSGTGSGSTSGLAPVITHLKLNPAAFPTNLGSTITYRTSESGTTVIRVLNRKGKVVRTIRHHDRAGNNGIGHKLTGLRPGRYGLKVVSSYNGHTSRAWTLTFTVRGKRK